MILSKNFLHRVPRQVSPGQKVAVKRFKQGQIRGRHLAVGEAAPARGGQAGVQHAIEAAGEGLLSDLWRQGGGDGGRLVRGRRGRDHWQVL